MAPTSPAQESSDDPLGEIAADMDRVVIELSGAHTGKPTQASQKRIVGKLDVLIKRLEEEAESARGGASGANPNVPLADSKIMGGPGGIGDLHAARKNGKQWGELPPHQARKDRAIADRRLSGPLPEDSGTLLQAFGRGKAGRCVR